MFDSGYGEVFWYLGFVCLLLAVVFSSLGEVVNHCLVVGMR